MENVRYKFYATLLDSFSRYLKSEWDEAFGEFIDKLNRVPFSSEAAEKGTAFNDMVDELKHGATYTVDDRGMVHYNGFKFRETVLQHFLGLFRNALPQVRTEAVLPTARGNVLLYGYMDELLENRVYDIKCTGRYVFPKFLHNWQHLVYPYCLQEQGVDVSDFTYEITDYNNIFREEYRFDRARDLVRLQGHCEHLIDFIEQHRELITDRKLFAMEGEAAS